ncbi:hypothetical protein ACWDZ4_31170 [Streptomyces sp. NPDC003016]
MSSDDRSLPGDAPSGGLGLEEKARLRKEFGERLKHLLGLAGIGAREFGRQYPAYAESIRSYTTGRTMPPLNVVEALLQEVARRSDLTPQALHTVTAGTLQDYRHRLGLLGTPSGSDQNSLLLRLYDLEMRLRAVTGELAHVREQETHIRARMGELNRPVGQPHRGTAPARPEHRTGHKEGPAGPAPQGDGQRAGCLPGPLSPGAAPSPRR